MFGLQCDHHKGDIYDRHGKLQNISFVLFRNIVLCSRNIVLCSQYIFTSYQSMCFDIYLYHTDNIFQHMYYSFSYYQAYQFYFCS